MSININSMIQNKGKKGKINKKSNPLKTYLLNSSIISLTLHNIFYLTC